MIIKLENVRLSFPALFKAKAGPDGGEPKFGASFLLDKTKHAAKIKEIEAAIEKLHREELKGKHMKGTCLHDGSEKPDTDGYGPGVKYVSVSSRKRVPIVDRDPSVALAEEDGKPYAGCYVNASIRLWVQDNQYGKRINAELRAVQFSKDGESFGAAPVDAEAEFATLTDEL
jgi:hypothetical protein